MIAIEQRTQALYLRPEPMRLTELDQRIRCWLVDHGIEPVDECSRYQRVIVVPHGYDHGCSQMSLRSLSLSMSARARDKKVVEILRFTPEGFELSRIGCQCDLSDAALARLERRMALDDAIRGVPFWPSLSARAEVNEGVS